MSWKPEALNPFFPCAKKASLCRIQCMRKSKWVQCILPLCLLNFQTSLGFNILLLLLHILHSKQVVNEESWLIEACFVENYKSATSPSFWAQTCQKSTSRGCSFFCDRISQNEGGKFNQKIRKWLNIQWIVCWKSEYYSSKQCIHDNFHQGYLYLFFKPILLLGVFPKNTPILLLILFCFNLLRTYALFGAEREACAERGSCLHTWVVYCA